MQNQTLEQRQEPRWRYGAATIWFALMLAAGLTDGAAARQKLPPSPPWTPQVKADSQVGAKNFADNSACAGLTKTINSKIETIRTLQAGIDTANSSMPTSLYGIYKKYKGEDATSPATKEKMHERDLARQTAEELNTLLAALKCPQVDIDQKLKADAKSADTQNSHSNAQ